ncbi:DUF2884 family protein [Thaumasiovibrio subtropicus]|uniref:DUF2884 family protein n=1 Tax=Thaumasiovibrio subtropicus TaxID=1891207 RepID=UPI000B350655|nr:DUF2884 family protein [Thaumasiovibrio subtropicus]
MRLGLMFILLAMVWPAIASTCYPQLHNDIQIRDGNVLIQQYGETFTISERGTLKFAVHNVSLRDEQQRALADYYAMLVTDLPYMRMTLRSELHDVVRHVDSLLVDQLGAQSGSRVQLAQFHHQMDMQVGQVFGFDEPHFRYQRLLEFSSQIEGQVDQLMLNMGVSGMKDLALQPVPEGQERMVVVTERLTELKDSVTDLLRDKRPKVQTLTHNFCQRLARWERQENHIQSLIPALKDWQTVTLH